jgi:hypothetical protein
MGTRCTTWIVASRSSAVLTEAWKLRPDVQRGEQYWTRGSSICIIFRGHSTWFCSHLIATAMTTYPQSHYFGIYQCCGKNAESENGWRCTLCNVDLHKQNPRTHIGSSSIHRNLVLKLAMGESCVSSTLARRTRIVPLESRLTKLEDTKWQLHVKGLLFDYLSTGDSDILQKVESSLKLYEHMGRLSLLELAVWKAACISQVEVDSKTSMKTFHDAVLCVAKHQHTWKKYRTETRKSNSIEIIIKQVLPFLDKP